MIRIKQFKEYFNAFHFAVFCW